MKKIILFIIVPLLAVIAFYVRSSGSRELVNLHKEMWE
jgi:hypothetical protein